MPRRAVLMCCAAVESLKPNLVVPSGAEVTVEMITHHAGDDPDKMIKVGYYPRLLKPPFSPFLFLPSPRRRPRYA